MSWVYLLLTFLLAACSSSPVREVATVQVNTAVLSPEQIEAAIKAENQTSLKLKEKGVSHFLKADYPNAIHQLETAFLFAPDSEDIKPKFHLFYAYLATGDFKKALTTAEYLADHYPLLSLSYQQLGLAHYFLGNATAALQALQKGLEFEAHSPRMHFYLGLVHKRLNQMEAMETSFRQAEKEYRQILKSNKEDLYAHYELASLFLFWRVNLKEVSEILEKTKSLLKSAREDLPEETRETFSKFYVPLLEGIYAYRQSNPKTAIEFLLNAFTNAPSGIKPDLAEAYFYLGLSHQMLGEKKQAQVLLEQSLALDPKGPLSEEASKSVRDLARAQ